MVSLVIPPIKCQGIKTKLVNVIKQTLPSSFDTWIEPFMGSGVVGFNVLPKKAIFSDTNPHLIRFYNDIKLGNINYQRVREFLYYEGEKLALGGNGYYLEVRKRFNERPNSLDFLFLNRSCFNGMMRFNSKGAFNVPFCKKPNRFAQSYITKITNQVRNIQFVVQNYDYNFICDTFDNVIKKAQKNDLIYCDPPYIDRLSDYYNQWNLKDENLLFQSLSSSKAKFIMSSWHHNEYRENKYIKILWNPFNITTVNHRYFVGGNKQNMHPMVEAIIKNF